MNGDAPSRMARDSAETALAVSSSLLTSVPARAARQLEQDSRAKGDGERSVATICKAGMP